MRSLQDPLRGYFSRNFSAAPAEDPLRALDPRPRVLFAQLLHGSCRDVVSTPIVPLQRWPVSARCCPELTDDLFRWDALAVCNLPAALSNRGSSRPWRTGYPPLVLARAR
jgi:hypothetical protein